MLKMYVLYIMISLYLGIVCNISTVCFIKTKMKGMTSTLSSQLGTV